MIIPVRCWSCGKPIAHLWDEYKERSSKDESVKQVLDDLGVDRYCCRAIILGHSDLIEQIARFKKF